MLDFDAICRVWEHLATFDAWFWRYLSCLSALGPHRAAFWTLIQTSQKGLWLQIHENCKNILKFSKEFIWKNEAWNLQILWVSQGPHFWRSLLAFDAWFWRYFSQMSALGPHRAAFRSRLWTLFVVIARTWPFYCLPSMLDFDAICRGRTSFGGHCLPSELHFECYLSWPDNLRF